MALQSSGAISLNDIHVEAGGSSGTQASINDSDIRGLIGKGSGVQMSFSEWYGAALDPPDPIEYTSAGTSSFTIESTVRAIGVQVLGAGGGGAGANATSLDGFGTGGGGAGGRIIAYYNVNGGETLTAVRGSGASGGTGLQNGSTGGSSYVRVGSTTIATGNGGGGGQIGGASAPGGSGGGTSSNASAYNVTANTGDAGDAGSGYFGFVGGDGADSPKGTGGAGGVPGGSPRRGSGGGNGTGQGAGGGGSATDDGGNYTGGSGSSGYIKIYFYTSPNPTANISW